MANRRGRPKVSALPEGFAESHESSANEDLRNIVIESSQVIREQKKAMKEDPVIISRSDDLKDLKGGYRDVIKAHQAKIEWCVAKLEERGNI